MVMLMFARSLFDSLVRHKPFVWSISMVIVYFHGWFFGRSLWLCFMPVRFFGWFFSYVVRSLFHSMISMVDSLVQFENCQFDLYGPSQLFNFQFWFGWLFINTAMFGCLSIWSFSNYVYQFITTAIVWSFINIIIPILFTSLSLLLYVSGWLVSHIAQFPSVWSVWLLTHAWLGQLWSLPHLWELPHFCHYLIWSLPQGIAIAPLPVLHCSVSLCSIVVGLFCCFYSVASVSCSMLYAPFPFLHCFVCLLMPMLLFVLFGGPCCMLHVALYSVGFVCSSILYCPCQLFVCCPMAWIRNRWWYGRSKHSKHSLRLTGIVYYSNFLTWYNSLSRPPVIAPKVIPKGKEGHGWE